MPWHHIVCAVDTLVSVLIQPKDRMQETPPAGKLEIDHVSILIQPEDRMQAERRDGSYHPPSRFNPHPVRRPDAREMRGAGSRMGCIGFQSSSSPKTGCKKLPPQESWRLTTFQSSSSPKTGCKRSAEMVHITPHRVSILIQSEDRTQGRCVAQAHAWAVLGFNPHPARRPDASGGCGQCLYQAIASFNPPPARRPDASGGCGQCLYQAIASFNPPPARRPDASSDRQ